MNAASLWLANFPLKHNHHQEHHRMLSSDQQAMPLFVDMDGTLIKADIAQELLLQNLKK